VIINGQLQYSKTVPNYSEVAKLAGIPKLKQETSTNYSAGFTWQPSKNFTATVDGYMIKMRDRIVVTGFYDASTAALTDYLNQNSLHSVNFFANAVNTTNTGIDVVLDYHHSWNRQHFNALLTGNIQKVVIDKVNMPSTLGSTYLDYQNFFGTQPQYSLIASAPHAKFAFSPEYGIDAVTFGARWTYWGKIVKVGNGSASIPGAKPDGPGGANISASGNGWDPYVQLDDGSNVVPEQFVYSGKVTTDFYFNYKISKAVTWIVGVDNLFNVHPDPAFTKGARQNSWNDFPTGGYFDNVQMGFNGMRMFSKLLLKF
jgi:iron complex outermembrane receptor protein